MVSICCACDGVIQEGMIHNCIRGLADKIDKLQKDIDKLLKVVEPLNPQYD